MKVIGAGLPRTATTSQADLAYEKLGFGPCYHMRDVLMDMEQGGLSQWKAVAGGNPTGRTIFGNASVDLRLASARAITRSWLEYYPDSKVVLSAARRRGLGAEHARHDRANLLRRFGDAPPV